MKKNYAWLIAIVILLFISLHFYNINKGFSHDDIRDIKSANRSVASLLKATVVEKGILPKDYPPAYFILLHFWLKLWGLNEVALRMLSMIIGFISLFLFYKITKTLFDGPTALLSVLLLSPYHIFIELNQSIRMYSLFFLLALLNFYLFILLLKRSNPIKTIFFVTISSILTYTHFYGLILVFTELFFTLFFVRKSKKSRKSLIISLVTIIILSSTFILHVIPAFRETSDEVTTICSFDLFINQFKFNMVEWLLFIVLLTLSILGSLDLLKQGKKRNESLFYLFLSIISLLVIFISSCLITFKIRHYTYLLPPLFMMASHYLIRLKKYKKTVILLLIFCLYIFSLNRYYTDTRDTDLLEWRSASEYIITNLSDEDYILLTWYSYQPMEHYLLSYSKDPLLSKRMVLFKDKSIEEIELILREVNRVWIVFHNESYECNLCRTNNTKEVLTYLNKEYKNTKIKYFKRNLNVLLYENKGNKKQT